MFNYLRQFQFFSKRFRNKQLVIVSAIGVSYFFHKQAYLSNKPSPIQEQSTHVYDQYAHENTNSELTYQLKTRNDHLQEAQSREYDVIIIGGGCTGGGIALECSQRGLKSLLIEANDFASGASSKSTKLVHGGVRYLQQVFELSTEGGRMSKLKLLIEALNERSSFLTISQTLTKPIPTLIASDSIFMTGYYYAGLMIYHLLYKYYSEKNTYQFNAPRIVTQSEIKVNYPLSNAKYGVLYEDGLFNDSRMVSELLFTSTLKNYHNKAQTYSNILNYCEVTKLLKNQTGQLEGVEMVDKLGQNKKYQIKSKIIINATGCFADTIRQLDEPEKKRVIIPAGGSHIILPKQYSGKKWGYLVPKTTDGRVLFILPWMGKTLVGTTDRKFKDPVFDPVCSHDELIWLIKSVSHEYKGIPITQISKDVQSKWCGLRPLVLAEGYNENDKIETKKIARNHIIEVSDSGLISVMGGKWTIFRLMAEDTVNLTFKLLQTKGENIAFRQSLSKYIRLMGDFDRNHIKPIQNKREYIAKYALKLRELYQVPYKDAKYFIKNYGDRSFDIFKLSQENPEKYRQKIDPKLPHTVGELVYLIRYEMAMKPQDLIYRRTRLGFLDNDKVIGSIYKKIVDIYSEEFNMTKEQKENFMKANFEEIRKLDF